MKNLEIEDWKVTAKLNEFDELVLTIEHGGKEDNIKDLVYEITDDTIRGEKYNVIFNYEIQ